MYGLYDEYNDNIHATSVAEVVSDELRETLPEAPDAFVAAIDYGFGELAIVASQGIEITEFDPDLMDPWDIDTIEQVDELDRQARMALAMLLAAAKGDDQVQTAIDLVRIIEVTLPEFRADILGEDRDEDEEDEEFGPRDYNFPTREEVGIAD